MSSKREIGGTDPQSRRLSLVHDAGDLTASGVPRQQADPAQQTSEATSPPARPGSSSHGDVTQEALSSDAASDAASNSSSSSGAEGARAVLADADPAAYYRMLNSLVRSSHSSVLGPLPYTPALSYHHPTCVVVEPEPTTIETAELYARAAYPDFDMVLSSAFADPWRDDLLTALYHLLVAEGENVALVTNHGQIIDIALVLAALHSAMLAEDRTFGVLGQRISLDELADRSNVLVSRMVTTRQAFSLPAIQVLQSITRVFLSVPQTASRRRVKLDQSLIRANNSLMRTELDKRMSKGGQLLAMAASGSQDLNIPALMQMARSAWRQRRGEDPGEVPTLHLQPLYDGTISLMKSCRYALPVAICLDSATPACVIGQLTQLRDKEDCHRIMDWIAMAHQQATGTPTIYHWHEDDLLTQVRGLINR